VNSKTRSVLVRGLCLKHANEGEAPCNLYNYCLFGHHTASCFHLIHKVSETELRLQVNTYSTGQFNTMNNLGKNMN
jgi:hypothetical protein